MHCNFSVKSSFKKCFLTMFYFFHCPRNKLLFPTPPRTFFFYKKNTLVFQIVPVIYASRKAFFELLFMTECFQFHYVPKLCHFKDDFKVLSRICKRVNLRSFSADLYDWTRKLDSPCINHQQFWQVKFLAELSHS